MPLLSTTPREGSIRFPRTTNKSFQNLTIITWVSCNFSLHPLSLGKMGDTILSPPILVFSGAHLPTRVSEQSSSQSDVASSHCTTFTQAKSPRSLEHTSQFSQSGSLVRKFWCAMELEGDYIHVATDRDVWKSLSESFLQWHGFTRTHNNVEMLEQNPWDKPKRLLHIPVAWIHLVFVGIAAGVFTAVRLSCRVFSLGTQ